jgi:hypothetical protein
MHCTSGGNLAIVTLTVGASFREKFAILVEHIDILVFCGHDNWDFITLVAFGRLVCRGLCVSAS